MVKSKIVKVWASLHRMHQNSNSSGQKPKQSFLIQLVAGSFRNQL
jgi:hypothetical protein